MVQGADRGRFGGSVPAATCGLCGEKRVDYVLTSEKKERLLARACPVCDFSAGWKANRRKRCPHIPMCRDVLAEKKGEAPA